MRTLLIEGSVIYQVLIVKKLPLDRVSQPVYIINKASAANGNGFTVGMDIQFFCCALIADLLAKI